ncbi:hypothetical protein ANN_24868 [Periplaneta americana]|uniref:Uncharacterized protein n=1 Tax=Periplaneta americana TaxID=6978 RepID=A0ABQ8S034_PERAM|nr:hypothetical protein ANN_24868 [Periplaneta americana]
MTGLCEGGNEPSGSLKDICEGLLVSHAGGYVRFMWRFRQTWNFTYLKTEDRSKREESDIVKKFTHPENSGGSARTMKMKHFDVDFSSFKEKVM